MSRPPPPKPWERGGLAGAPGPSAGAEAPRPSSSIGLSSTPGLPPGPAPPEPLGGYGSTLGPAYGQAQSGYGGAGYPGAGYSSAGYPSASYPSAGYAGAYGGYGSAYSSPYSSPYGGGSPFYRPGLLGGSMYGGPDPSQLLPDMLGGGLRKLEHAMFAFGRITQLLEMNLETVLRFVGSLAAFGERMHSVSGEVSSLTTSLHRQSLEFGERSLARLRQVRVNRRRLATALLLALAFVLRWRGRPHAPVHRRPLVRSPRALPSASGGGGGGVSGEAALDSVWEVLRTS